MVFIFASDWIVGKHFFILFLVYVFLGTAMSLIDLMNTMQSVQLFDNGEYMVIYVDMDTYSDKQAHKYLYSKSEKCNVFISYDQKIYNHLYYFYVSCSMTQNRGLVFLE